MAKKILFVILWTGVLPICAILVVTLVSVAYSKAVIYITGSWPSDAARQTMATIWTDSGMIMMPIALILAALGMLPGTRLSPGSPNVSARALCCYRALIAVALCGMLLSIVGQNTVGDYLTIGALVIALIVAGLTKWSDTRRSRMESCPDETDNMA